MPLPKVRCGESTRRVMSKSNGLLCWANSVIAHAGWFRVVSAPASRTAWVMLCNSECLSPLLGRVQRLLWGDRCRGWLCHCVRSTSCLKLL